MCRGLNNMWFNKQDLQTSEKNIEKLQKCGDSAILCKISCDYNGDEA